MFDGKCELTVMEKHGLSSGNSSGLVCIPASIPGLLPLEPTVGVLPVAPWLVAPLDSQIRRVETEVFELVLQGPSWSATLGPAARANAWPVFLCGCHGFKGKKESDRAPCGVWKISRKAAVRGRFAEV